jgi:feruloyl-CoA synthase
VAGGLEQMTAPFRDVALGAPDISVDRRPDGVILAKSPHPLPQELKRMTDALVYWASAAPDRLFMAQRDGDGPWNTINYRHALNASRAIASALLSRKLSKDRPIAILSGNDLGQALLSLGAQFAGVPFAPISPAYSLVSQDFSKLRYVLGMLNPGMIYVSSGKQFAKAIAAVVPADVEIVVAVDPLDGRKTTLLADLTKTMVHADLDRVHAGVGPDTIVKILFTSGSTGNPKGVINTQRMLTSNQAMMQHHLPFLLTVPPVLVDWLPWSHTFGGNHNVNLVLANGGTLYIDDGKPVPGAFDMTLRNLTEVAPTMYFNVPKGFEVLAGHLKTNKVLAETFYSRMSLLFYAGASLPQHVWDGLDEAAVATTGQRVRMLTGLGSTETAPAVFNSTALCDKAGMVGVPLPGIEVKLVPNGGKLEARIKGPNITPGYWKQPEQTKAAFDDEGFYVLGDALKFADPNDPRKGFVFDGRVAEDFKLVTGTWVSVGPLRSELVTALAPYVRDCVITGHDRDNIGALLVPDLEACRALTKAATAQLATDPTLITELAKRLTALAASSTGSSTLVARALVLTDTLQIDQGEVTDKGSINQRAVLTNRASLVDELYADTPSSRVIKPTGRAKS